MTEFFVRGTVPTQADNWWVEGCPRHDGARSVALKPQERAPGNVWQKYTDLDQVARTLAPTTTAATAGT